MVPDYQSVMLPLLKYMADGAVRNRNVIINEMKDVLCLSAEDRQELTPAKTQKRADSNIGWAMSYLKQAGVLQILHRSHWIITDTGRALLAENIPEINNRVLEERYASFREFVKNKNSHKLKASCNETNLFSGREEEYTTSVSDISSSAEYKDYIRYKMHLDDGREYGDEPTEEQLAKLKQKKDKVTTLILSGIDLSAFEKLKDVVGEPLTLVVTIRPREGVSCKYAPNLNADAIEGIDVTDDKGWHETPASEERERRARRPNWNFYNLGLKDGDRICFDGNEKEVATIISRKGVEYEGEEFETLAILTQIIGNYGERVNPIFHWTFHGRQLSDIYDEKFPKE